jgi:hypothetical protein
MHQHGMCDTHKTHIAIQVPRMLSSIHCRNISSTASLLLFVLPKEVHELCVQCYYCCTRCRCRYRRSVYRSTSMSNISCIIMHMRTSVVCVKAAVQHHLMQLGQALVVTHLAAAAAAAAVAAEMTVIAVTVTVTVQHQPLGVLQVNFNNLQCCYTT